MSQREPSLARWLGLILLLVLAANVLAEQPKVLWKKMVTEKSSFVLYAPTGWRATEATAGPARVVGVSDPTGAYAVTFRCGPLPQGWTAYHMAGVLLGTIARQAPDVALTDAKMDPRTQNTVLGGTYTQKTSGKREFRCWTTAGNGLCTAAMIAAPAGRLAAAKPTLLGVLANIRVLKGAFAWKSTAPTLKLVRRALPGNTAGVLIPADWKLTSLGNGMFFAHDAQHTVGMLSLMHEAATPRMPVRPAGMPVSWGMNPHKAFAFFAGILKSGRDFRYGKIVNRPDLARLAGTMYNRGPITVEEFDCTYTGKTGRCRAYNLGVYYGTTINTNWRFYHLTVWAKADKFPSLANDFVAMVQGYSLNPQFVRAYVARGMAVVRAMQRQTAAIVARNAREIRQMNYQAFRNRMDSKDYTDYLFTRYMRGEQDWVSGVEGGRVYRSNSWGMEDARSSHVIGVGKPLDYLHFTGQGTLLKPINSRAMYEKYVRGR